LKRHITFVHDEETVEDSDEDKEDEDPDFQEPESDSEDRKYSRSQRQYNIIKHTDGGERPYECHICHNRFKEVRHQIQTLSLLISMYSNIVHIYLEQDGT
jgi:hypothetical protein